MLKNSTDRNMEKLFNDISDKILAYGAVASSAASSRAMSASVHDGVTKRAPRVVLHVRNTQEVSQFLSKFRGWD